MRVAFIVSQFPALSETFILDQITGLIDRGHTVDIYARRRHPQATVQPEVERYGLSGRVCYLDPEGNPPRGILRRLGGGARRALKLFPHAPGAVLQSLNVVRWGRPAASLSVVYEIAPFLERGPYDIVHCQFGPNGVLGAALRDRGAFRGKIVTTFRGYDVLSYLKANGPDAYAELFQKGDMFLSVSERIRQRLVASGCNPAKIRVHRSGVDTRKFAFVSRRPDPTRTVHILTVGRLVEKKGVRFGIEAVARALEGGAELRYTIVGDGPLRGELEGLIDALGVGARVRLLGPRSRDAIIDLLGEADILLAPSVTSVEGDEEGLPGVIREAFARGVPVVSTRHAGIPEIVQDGVSGLLVPERDVDGIVRCLERMIGDPELRVAMGRAGRNCVEAHFDIEKLNDALVGIYRRLANGEALPGGHGNAPERLAKTSAPERAGSA